MAVIDFAKKLEAFQSEVQKINSAWDDDSAQWLFSISDIVGVLTESADPRKYWSVLKNRLKQKHPELTTRCSQLKMTAADGKRSSNQR